MSQNLPNPSPDQQAANRLIEQVAARTDVAEALPPPRKLAIARPLGAKPAAGVDFAQSEPLILSGLARIKGVPEAIASADGGILASANIGAPRRLAVGTVMDIPLGVRADLPPAYRLAGESTSQLAGRGCLVATLLADDQGQVLARIVNAGHDTVQIDHGQACVRLSAMASPILTLC